MKSRVSNRRCCSSTGAASTPSKEEGTRTRTRTRTQTPGVEAQYRKGVLPFVLCDALGRGTRSIWLGCVSPDGATAPQTLSTMRLLDAARLVPAVRDAWSQCYHSMGASLRGGGRRCATRARSASGWRRAPWT